MNALRNFFTPEAGQARTNWLNNVLQTYVADPVNYYLGPSGVPNRLQAAGNALEFTDAGDMPAAADAGRRLWNDPSIGNAAEYAAAGAAMMLPMYSARMGEGIADLADDLVRGYDPETLNAFRVWHGSPHDFDRFSMDKIGTGEGAQAYGHGLYFAENADVADMYRRTVGSMHKGRAVNWDDPAVVAEYWANMYGGRDEGIRYLESVLKSQSENPKAYEPGAREATIAGIEHLKSGAKIDSGGALYEVAIDANPEDFLDWDAPLSAQPQKVRESLAAMDPDTYSPSGDDYDPTELGQITYQRLQNQKRDYGVDSGRTDLTTLGGSQRGATDDLQGFGIPGIRYLDAGSRGAGDGSRNYVLFDDNLATILSKNGEQMNTLEAERMRREIDAFLSENGY